MVAGRTVGRVVKSLRLRRGLSRRRLAETLTAGGVKLSIRGLLLIEKDRTDPRLSRLRALASALGVRLKDLLPENGA